MAIMFCIYTITLLLSLSMLKHPTYVSLSFHLRGVESESAGEFGKRCREVLRDVVERGIVVCDKDSAFVITSSFCVVAG